MIEHTFDVYTRYMESRGDEESVALLALLALKPGGRTWDQIANEVALTGSAVAVLDEVRQDSATLFDDPAIEKATADATRALAQWSADGLDFISILSERYPAHLAQVFDAPPFLFARGLVDPTDRGMSVVGSRHCTPEGCAMARDAVRILAEHGLTTIAGLAEGIDTAAHRAALDLGVRTVAVLGTGIRKYAPAANRALQDEIAERGLLLSQFYPDQPPTKQTFPMRNGTMSGYGLATIVVEAGEYSGTRIQARRAADHGRPVIMSAHIAESTTWGRSLAGAPGTWVVRSRSEVEQAVDEVIEASSTEWLRDMVAV